MQMRTPRLDNNSTSLHYRSLRCIQAQPCSYARNQCCVMVHFSFYTIPIETSRKRRSPVKAPGRETAQQFLKKSHWKKLEERCATREGARQEKALVKFRCEKAMEALVKISEEIDCSEADRFLCFSPLIEFSLRAFQKVV